MLEIKKIEADMTYQLRHQILRPHMSLSDCHYDTDCDPDGFHVGAFVEGELVTIVSFCTEKHPNYGDRKQYRLRAMATKKEYRKQGFGRAVVEFGIRDMMERGYDFLWCKGRTPVQGYYEKLGFTSFGEPYDYPGIGMHIDMIKELK